MDNIEALCADYKRSQICRYQDNTPHLAKSTYNVIIALKDELKIANERFVNLSIEFNKLSEKIDHITQIDNMKSHNI